MSGAGGGGQFLLSSCLTGCSSTIEYLISIRKSSPQIIATNLAHAYLGIVPLDLEQLRVLEDDGAVGLLGVGGRRAPERLAVRLGQQVVRLGLRQGAAVLLPAKDHGRHGAVHRARQQDLQI